MTMTLLSIILLFGCKKEKTEHLNNDNLKSSLIDDITEIPFFVNGKVVYANDSIDHKIIKKENQKFETKRDSLIYDIYNYQISRLGSIEGGKLVFNYSKSHYLTVENKILNIFNIENDLIISDPDFKPFSCHYHQGNMSNQILLDNGRGVIHLCDSIPLTVYTIKNKRLVKQFEIQLNPNYRLVDVLYEKEEANHAFIFSYNKAKNQTLIEKIDMRNGQSIINKIIKERLVAFDISPKNSAVLARGLNVFYFFDNKLNKLFATDQIKALNAAFYEDEVSLKIANADPVDSSIVVLNFDKVGDQLLIQKKSKIKYPKGYVGKTQFKFFNKEELVYTVNKRTPKINETVILLHSFEKTKSQPIVLQKLIGNPYIFKVHQNKFEYILYSEEKKSYQEFTVFLN